MQCVCGGGGGGGRVEGCVSVRTYNRSGTPKTRGGVMHVQPYRKQYISHHITNAKL